MEYLILILNAFSLAGIGFIFQQIAALKAKAKKEISKTKADIEDSLGEVKERINIINIRHDAQFAAVQGINKRLDAIKPEKKEWDELDQQRKKLNAEIKAFESKNQYLNVKGFIEHCDAVVKENMSAKGKLPTVNGPSHYEIQIEMYESAKEAVRKYAGRKVSFQEDF